MSNHAYESAAALRPSSNGPIPISTLSERFSLAPASAEDAAALNDLSILGVSVDSADTAPGELFVGLPGFTVHGARFAAEAVASGAVAVLTDSDGAQIVHESAPGTPVLVHGDPRAIVGPLSAEAYHHPARGLITTAVTGTNGKTTTAYFLDAILSAHVGGCMVAGTVELRVGERSVESPRTTVEAPVLQRMMALAAEAPIEIDRVRAYPGETPADWWVSDAAVSLTDSATTFTLHGPDGEKIEASCPLPGLVNVQNAALALVMAIRAGVPAATAAMALAGAHNIPGRMQRISQRDGRRGLCIVDFAHTPDAMELALKAVRPITPGRLIVVFGSDGDRDQGKRPMLGQVCARLADVLVVTDENPRSEDPQLIRDAILDGVRGVRPDLKDVEEITTWRGDAVRRGVELCGPDDTVIVTGKGHEPFLEMAGEFIRYNDAPVMAEAVEEKWGRA